MNKKRNTDIYRELNAVPLLDFLKRYWTACLHHMNKYTILRSDEKLQTSWKKILDKTNQLLNETVTGP